MPLSQTPGCACGHARARERVMITMNSLGRLVDQKDFARLPRACSCCGAAFQPTMRRRMLCGSCYRQGSSIVENATVGIMES